MPEPAPEELGPHGRPRDLHYEAFAFAFGEPATKSERSILNRAAREAKLAELVPREIVLRARRALKEFPNATPMIVVQRWSRWAEKPTTPAPTTIPNGPEDPLEIARQLGREWAHDAQVLATPEEGLAAIKAMHARIERDLQ